ncbi:hypothetical protein D9M71_371570 [compost metagenome]
MALLATLPTLLFNWSRLTASVPAVPAPTLVICRSLPALPTDTLLARSATELAPRATELSAVAWALEPIAVLLAPEAMAPAPPAVASAPVGRGCARRLVLFTWNMPSVPLSMLVT